MGWIKTQLDDDSHAKLKHFRDLEGHRSLDEAVAACVEDRLETYEEEHGELPTEYDKTEHPTWGYE